MSRDILFSLWFLFPAAAANSAPIFASALPILRNWDTPIDGNRQFRGKPILGSHKTWRGLICGIIVSTLVFWLLQKLAPHVSWAADVTSEYGYQDLGVFPLGPLLGLGALGGDAIESFFKRRRGVPSGETWLPFDQLDYVVGALVISLPIIRFPLRVYVYMLVLWFIIHLLGSYSGWLLHLKEKPI